MVNWKDDKRGFIRVPFNTEVEVLAQGRAIRSRKGIDISMSGLRLSTGDAVPAEGSPCEVTIILEALENRVLVKAGGKVIRSEPGSLAVEFTELDLDSYCHLRQVILYNTDEPGKSERELAAHWGIRPRKTL